MTFGPTGWQRAGLIAGAGGVLALGVVLFLARRKRREPRYDATYVEPGARIFPALGAVLSVVIGVLVSGLPGAVVGVVCLFVPQRLLRWGIGLSMALAGVFLAAFGVVDRQSAGAILGQLAGTVTVCLLARRLGSGDEPTPAPVAPASPPTSAPPPPTGPSPRPASP